MKSATKDEEERFLPVHIEEYSKYELDIILDAIELTSKTYVNQFRPIPPTDEVLRNYKSIKYRDAQKRLRAQNNNLLQAPDIMAKFWNEYKRLKAEGLDEKEIFIKLSEFGQKENNGGN